MRLIDADELKRAIEQGEGFSWDSHGKDDLCVRKKYIDNAPTVEARIDPNDIYYLCDHKRCGENFTCYECNHTSDIRHAVNFDLVEFPRSAFYEIDRPHGEWIAVKDRLPDTAGEYLVSLDNGRIVVADERSIIENHDFEPKMMAWQPLPESYRAEVDK